MTTASAATARAALAPEPTGLLIAGAWREARSGSRLPVRDPATDAIIGRVADAGPEDCRDALAAAHAAAPGWAATPPRERSRILRRAADALRERTEEIAGVVTSEMGKPLAESRDEVTFAADYVEWFAEEAVRIDGRCTLAPDGLSRHVVMRTPVGPTLVVTPWNFPLAVPARGVAPALAAGCTVVLRASTLTPLCAIALAGALAHAGLPAGVLNLVVSSQDDATDVLLDDPRLRKLTFTGSEAVGRHLIRRAADAVLRVSVELGGCAPFIVFDDADLDDAVACAVAAKMRNGGAACTAANRFYVQRAIADAFIARLAARIARVRIGHGSRRGVGLGPMISRRHRGRLQAMVDDAVARGARVVVRGGPVPGPGAFMTPVVLVDVPEDARLMQEEIFGPVVAIAVFDDEDEVVTRANARGQGLAAYVQTGDLVRGMRVAAALEAGMVALNRGRVSCIAAPFGGVKRSGHGLSGGREGIDEYLDTRYLTMPEERGAVPGGTVVALPTRGSRA